MRHTDESTTSTLIRGLQDHDEGAWTELDARFRVVLVRFGERFGLTPADAADAAQEALVQFYESTERFDRDRGRLRTWLIRIAKHRIIDMLRSKARSRKRIEALARIPSRELEAIWDEESNRDLIRRALEELPQCTRIKPKTIEAFRLFAINQVPAQEVACDLGMTIDAVYLAKHQCMKRVRQIARRLECA